MDPDTKEQIDELKANIEDAKKDRIPWNTMVSITKIFSSTFERSNILNSLLLNELKEYKILQTDLRNENQRLKEIARIAEELVKASAKAVEGTNYGSGENSLEVDPLEKSGKDSRGIIEDFMEKDPLALPVENPREIPRVKFVNSIEKNGVIVLTLDDDTCKNNLKPKKANEIFVEVENQDDNQVLTTTKNILYDACSGSSGGTGNGILKKRKMTQKIIPENDLIEIVIDSSNHSPSANKENMKNLSFNLQSLGTSMSPTIKEKNKLSKQTPSNELVLPQRRTRYGNMSKKNNNTDERSIHQMEMEIELKEMVLKIPRLDDKTIAQYTSKQVYTTPKSSGRGRGRPRKNINQQLPEVLNIEEEPQRHSEEPIKSASTSLKDFRSNVNDLLQVEEIELSPPKKARYNSKTPHLTVYEKSLEFQRKNNAATNKQLQDYGDVSIDEDFSPIGKTRSASKKTTSTPNSYSKTSTPKSQSKIVVVPFVDQGQRMIEQNTVTVQNANNQKEPAKSASDVIPNKTFLQCRFCDESYEKQANLKNHVLNHFKEKLLPFIPMIKPFNCPECNQISRDRITLLRHFAFTHNNVLKFATEDDFKARIPNSDVAALPTTDDALEPVVQID